MTKTRSKPEASAPTSEQNGEAFKLPSPATLRRLKLSKEVGWYLVTRGIELPNCPPAFKTPEGDSVPGAAFDPSRVDLVLKSFGYLRHTQGELAGQPLNPDPWQVAYIIAPAFGWVVEDPDSGRWIRLVNSLYVEMPRKNGKSTLSGGLALYLMAADGEQGAQVLAAASTRDQAGFVFNPIKSLVEKSPALRGRMRPLAGKIIHPKSGSYFQVISSIADAQHGANVHGAIIDELHIHKNGDLVEAIETGTGSRSQPMIVIITTADEGKPGTVYASKRKTIESLSRGSIKNPTSYGVIWCASKDDDPFSVKTLRKANPGYGVSPKARYLTGKARDAKNDPTFLNTYKRLHLGIRIKNSPSYISLEAWDRNAGEGVTPEMMEGRTCYGGLDLASVSDVTALAWLFPFEDGTEGYHALFRFWIPEAALPELDKRTANNASAWVRAGFLETTPGNVTDYAFVQARIVEDYERYSVRSIGFDRWNATQITTNLMNEGIPMVQVGQGYASASPALKELNRLVLRGKPGDERIHHGGNPVMRWMTDNLTVAMDPAGNVKPDKAAAADKIDGWSALTNAMFESLADGQEFDSSDATGLSFV